MSNARAESEGRARENSRLREENAELRKQLQKCQDAHALSKKRKAIERNGTG